MAQDSLRYDEELMSESFGTPDEQTAAADAAVVVQIRHESRPAFVTLGEGLVRASDAPSSRAMRRSSALMLVLQGCRVELKTAALAIATYDWDGFGFVLEQEALPLGSVIRPVGDLSAYVAYATEIDAKIAEDPARAAACRRQWEAKAFPIGRLTLATSELAALSSGRPPLQVAIVRPARASSELRLAASGNRLVVIDERGFEASLESPVFAVAERNRIFELEPLPRLQLEP